jgi:hypothetical protein
MHAWSIDERGVSHIQTFRALLVSGFIGNRFLPGLVLYYCLINKAVLSSWRGLINWCPRHVIGCKIMQDGDDQAKT